MIESVLNLLKDLPPEWITLCVGALPVFELRGAIPVGVALGLPIQVAYGWAVLGNLLPVIPLLLFLEGVSSWLRSRYTFWDKFFVWLFFRTSARTRHIYKMRALGLALFVMVPLPITGAWTGCAAAYIFQFPFRVAFPAIAGGVLCAGGLVSLAVQMGIQFFYTSAP